MSNSNININRGECLIMLTRDNANLLLASYLKPLEALITIMARDNPDSKDYQPVSALLNYLEQLANGTLENNSISNPVLTILPLFNHPSQLKEINQSVFIQLLNQYCSNQPELKNKLLQFCLDLNANAIKIQHHVVNFYKILDENDKMRLCLEFNNVEQCNNFYTMLGGETKFPSTHAYYPLEESLIRVEAKPTCLYLHAYVARNKELAAVLPTKRDLFYQCLPKFDDKEKIASVYLGQDEQAFFNDHTMHEIGNKHPIPIAILQTSSVIKPIELMEVMESILALPTYIGSTIKRNVNELLNEIRKTNANILVDDLNALGPDIDFNAILQYITPLIPLLNLDEQKYTNAMLASIARFVFKLDFSKRTIAYVSHLADILEKIPVTEEEKLSGQIDFNRDELEEFFKDLTEFEITKKTNFTRLLELYKETPEDIQTIISQALNSELTTRQFDQLTQYVLGHKNNFAALGCATPNNYRALCRDLAERGYTISSKETVDHYGNILNVIDSAGALCSNLADIDRIEKHCYSVILSGDVNVNYEMGTDIFQILNSNFEKVKTAIQSKSQDKKMLIVIEHALNKIMSDNSANSAEKRSETILNLLNAGLSANFMLNVNGQSQSLLNLAMLANHQNVVEYVAEHNGVLFFEKDANGNIPLIVLASCFHQLNVETKHTINELCAKELDVDKWIAILTLAIEKNSDKQTLDVLINMFDQINNEMTDNNAKKIIQFVFALGKTYANSNKDIQEKLQYVFSQLSSAVVPKLDVLPISFRTGIKTKTETIQGLVLGQIMATVNASNPAVKPLFPLYFDFLQKATKDTTEYELCFKEITSFVSRQLVSCIDKPDPFPLILQNNLLLLSEIAKENQFKPFNFTGIVLAAIVKHNDVLLQHILLKWVNQGKGDCDLVEIFNKLNSDSASDLMLNLLRTKPWFKACCYTQLLGVKNISIDSTITKEETRQLLYACLDKHPKTFKPTPALHAVFSNELSYAILQGDFRVALRILDLGLCDINEEFNFDITKPKTTLLNYALREKNGSLLKELISRGAAISHLDAATQLTILTTLMNDNECVFAYNLILKKALSVDIPSTLLHISNLLLQNKMSVSTTIEHFLADFVQLKSILVSYDLSETLLLITAIVSKPQDLASFADKNPNALSNTMAQQSLFHAILPYVQSNYGINFNLISGFKKCSTLSATGLQNVIIFGLHPSCELMQVWKKSSESIHILTNYKQAVLTAHKLRSLLMNPNIQPVPELHSADYGVCKDPNLLGPIIDVLIANKLLPLPFKTLMEKHDENKTFHFYNPARKT